MTRRTRSTLNAKPSSTGSCAAFSARWVDTVTLNLRDSETALPAELPLAAQLRNVILHLRLPIELTLAPLYLWGVFGAGGRLTMVTAAGFLALHLFLYGGTTLFNSYYDRDEGPIMGMERPVGLPTWALPFSLVWQVAGALVAATVSLPFALFYLAYAVAGALYSHPRPRLKRRPFTSAFLVLVFQGLGGFVAGWLASTRASIPLGDARFLAMALVAACTTLGLYPLTQVFQVDEDAARGDRTLAMVLGPAGSFAFAVGAFVVAAPLGLLVLLAMGRPFDGALIAVGYVLMAAVTVVVGRQFARSPLVVNFRRLAALQYTASGAFGLFIVLQFVRL